MHITESTQIQTQDVLQANLLGMNINLLQWHRVTNMSWEKGEPRMKFPICTISNNKTFLISVCSTLFQALAQHNIGSVRKLKLSEPNM